MYEHVLLSGNFCKHENCDRFVNFVAEHTNQYMHVAQQPKTELNWMNVLILSNRNHYWNSINKRKSLRYKRTKNVRIAGLKVSMKPKLVRVKAQLFAMLKVLNQQMMQCVHLVQPKIQKSKFVLFRHERKVSVQYKYFFYLSYSHTLQFVEYFTLSLSFIPPLRSKPFPNSIFCKFLH